MNIFKMVGGKTLARKRWLALAALFCAGFLRPVSSVAQTAIPSGPLINVDFCAAANPFGLGSIETGFAAIGQTTNDYWNPCSRDGAVQGQFLTFVPVSNLTNADGSVSGVGLTLANAPGCWWNNAADPMYNVYLYPFNGGNITLTVTNLPAGAYDFYLYGHGDNQNGTFANVMNGVYDLSVGGSDYGTQSTATSGTNWLSATWQEGQQYVVFRGVSISSSADVVVITGLPGLSGEALIAGMQIAPSTNYNPPEPIAPVITNQPANQTAYVGSTVTFTVGATGTAPLSYQWLQNSDPLLPATNSSLTLTNVQLGQSGNFYSVIVSNGVTSTNSTAAMLTVNPLPNAPVTLLDINFFAAKNPGDLGLIKTGFAAIGLSTNDYWNGCSRDGAVEGDFLTFVAINNLTNADGSVTGAGLTLANAPGSWSNGVNDPMYDSYLYPFNGGNITLTLTNVPAGAYDIAIYGHGSTQNGTFQTVMNGVYQLSSGGVDYGTQSTATSGTNWASTNWQEGQQFVVFRNVTVTDPTQPLVVTGLPGLCGEALIAGMQIAPAGTFAPVAPTIVTAPVSESVFVGANATFTVTASGTAPLSYQWFENSSPISQATNTSYTVTNAQAGESGYTYSVTVSNSVNSTNSGLAILTVNPVPNGPVALLNLQFFANKNPDGLGTVKTGFAAIGLSAGDYWNGISRDGASDTDWLSLVTVNNLTNADGSISGAGLTLANAPGSWGNGVDDAMYGVYLYPFNGGNLTVTVTNLPVGAYDIYVYGHGSTQNGYYQNMNGVYQLSSGGNDYGTLSTATNGTGWDSTVWQAGQQYVVFRNVTVYNSTQPVVLTGLPGASGEALIAGMQIAPAAGIAATAPVIVNQPASQSVYVGSTVTFSVGVTGTPPLSYQWLENSDPIALATNSSYTLTNVQLGQSGNTYAVVVSNNVNSTNSTAAVLTVNPGISGALVDVNFCAAANPDGLGAIETGFAAIGQATNDFWNVCSRDGTNHGQFLTFVTVSNLVTVDGTVAAAGLTLSNAPGAWFAGVTDPMYNVYLYPFNGGNITLTVTNLPAGAYDFYLYGHGDTQNGMFQNVMNGVYDLSVGTNDYGTLSTATNGTNWASTNWQEGQQYVLFSAVQVSDPTQPVVITGLPGLSGEALIAGLQISQEANSPAVLNHVAFGRPVLKMSTAYGSLIISWPATAAGFDLQSSPSMSPAIWTAVTTAPVTNGNQITVTLPMSAAGRVYRLNHP